MTRREPLEEKLEEYGVYVEQREVGKFTELAASMIGSIAGHALARAARLGPVGAIVCVLGGSIVGHIAVTTRVRYEPVPRRPARPESPAKFSDRR